jgi:hypothetical protein
MKPRMTLRQALMTRPCSGSSWRAFLAHLRPSVADTKDPANLGQRAAVKRTVKPW